MEKETKGPFDLITDGILAYGVDVVRFIFEESRTIVYAISDLPHITASDCVMTYQISKSDYDKLLAMSIPSGVPNPPVPSVITKACRRCFLCGQSAYCERYKFTLEDADETLTERY